MNRVGMSSSETLWHLTPGMRETAAAPKSLYPLDHPVLLAPLDIKLIKKEKEARNAVRMDAFNELRLAYGKDAKVTRTLNMYRLPTHKREAINPVNRLYALETSAAEYRMLKKPEVYPLFQLMENGLETYAQLDGSPKESSQQEQKAMMRAVAANSVLLHTNLRLPLHITRKNFSPKYGEHPQYEDVGMASIHALDRSIQLFDYRYGWMLSSFAVRVINSRVERFITNTLRPVRIPANVDEDHRRIGRATIRLRATLQREPTIAEIATTVDCSEPEVVKLQQLGHYYAVSLDEKIAKFDGDNDLTRGELQVDSRPANSPTAALEEADDHVVIQAAMAEVELSVAERVILSLRHQVFDEALVGIDAVQPSYEQLFQQAADRTDGLPWTKISGALGNITYRKAKLLEETALAKLAMSDLASSLA